MRERNHQIQSVLELLLDLVHADFIALALLEEESFTYHWEYSIGARSGRVENMTFRGGQGIGGQAIRFGRPMFWSKNPQTLKSNSDSCPVIEAEQLRVAVSIPLTQQSIPFGAVIVARREDEYFSLKEFEQITQIIDHLKLLLEPSDYANINKGGFG